MTDQFDIDYLVKRLEDGKRAFKVISFIHILLELNHIIVRKDERSTMIINDILFDMTGASEFLRDEGFIKYNEYTDKERSYQEVVEKCLRGEYRKASFYQTQIQEMFADENTRASELMTATIEKIERYLDDRTL